MEFEVKNIALDIHDIRHSERGQKVVNELVNRAGVLFKTKRGRMAVLLKLDSFDKVRRLLKVKTKEGMDGLNLVILPKEPRAHNTQENNGQSNARLA